MRHRRHDGRLAAQRDRDFTLVVVDNASTDGTRAAVERACAAAGLAVEVIDEPRKGTGAAADTGVRHAIAHGATHVLRTDADTLPAPGWTAAARRAFAGGADLVTGPMRARSDEVRLKAWERVVLPGVIGVVPDLRAGCARATGHPDCTAPTG